MEIKTTPLEGCLLITPRVFKDDRGYFFESFNQQHFNEAVGYNVQFVQDNESFSTKGVLRGLHYQEGDYAQAKLVRVVQGRVLDVAVDIRPDSPTYGHHFSVELSAANKQQLFIPRGFAHGFVVLSDTAVFAYKCDNYYHKAAEAGILYNDPSLNIDWKLPEQDFVLSEKDKELPLFNQLKPL
jgi:dTDP-4-dehydrorhamnose 3,5-epimerase